MSMNRNERALLESFQAMLSSEDLGLTQHAADHKRSGKLERGLEYLHNHIDEAFRLKASGLTHYTGVCAAFSKVHNYKYIDDPEFWTAMQRELRAQAVPQLEQDEAHSAVNAMIEELKKFDVAKEADFGFSPDLEDVMSVPE